MFFGYGAFALGGLSMFDGVGYANGTLPVYMHVFLFAVREGFLTVSTVASVYAIFCHLWKQLRPTLAGFRSCMRSVENEDARADYWSKRTETDMVK